jgi:hypothetical protein
MDHARRCDFDHAALDDPKVPRELRRICLKAMAADPAGRYPSAEAFQKDLKHYLARPRILAALAGGCGLVLLLGLVPVAVWSRPDRIPSHYPLVVIQPQPPAPGSLAGELTVRVWSQDAGGKRGLRVDEPGALPVRTGERVQLEVWVNQPAYLYVLWLDSQGHVDPLYPWERDFKKLGEAVTARERLEFPPEADNTLAVEGPSGLETAILLARRTPLPATTDLAALIGSLPPAPLRDPREVALLVGVPGSPVRIVNPGLHRGLGHEAKRIDESLLQLRERLRPHFELFQAVRFAFQAD